MRFDLVVVGCSWGGLDALGRLLPGLPAGFGAPVVVVQHRGAQSNSAALIAALERRVSLPVREVSDKDPITAGEVHLAPADYHLLVEPGAFALSIDDRVQFSRPSVDVLFESAADAYGERVIGVILTGANSDGAAGLARIKSRGGYAIVQDPSTAVRRAMPDAAIAATTVDRVLPLEQISAVLGALCGVAENAGGAR